MEQFFKTVHAISIALEDNVVGESEAETMVLDAFYKQFGNDRLIWALTYFQKLERDNQKKEISKYRTSLQFSAGLFHSDRPTSPEILFYLKGAFPEGTCKGYSEKEIKVFNDLVSKLNRSQVDDDWLERYEMNEYIQILKTNNYVD